MVCRTPHRRGRCRQGRGRRASPRRPLRQQSSAAITFGRCGHVRQRRAAQIESGRERSSGTIRPMDDYGPETYGERIADVYDQWYPDAPPAMIDRLAELAGEGRALELAIGTGRVALPLLARGVDIHGVDVSEGMVARLRAKQDGDRIPVSMGDFADGPRRRAVRPRLHRVQHAVRPAHPAGSGPMLPQCRRPVGARRRLRHRGFRPRPHPFRPGAASSRSPRSRTVR